MIRKLAVAILMSSFILFLQKNTTAQTVSANIVGYNPTDNFSYQGKNTPHYGIQWTADNWDSSGSSMWASSYGGIKLFTHGLPRLSINSLGNIGIGTLEPNARLNINSLVADSSVSTLKFGVPGDRGNTFVPKGNSPGGYNIDFATWRDVAPDQIGSRIRAERVNTYSDNKAFVQGMDLVFYTSQGGSQSQLSEQLRITNDGNIGIGTAVPKSKLTVNGTIQSKEIKVTNAASDWPDYVFDNNYELPTLEDVAKQIHKKRHLPGMASAKEILQKGIDIGYVTSQQQKKIEELTLYLIDQQKKIDAQNIEIKKMKSALEQIQKKLAESK